MGCFDARCGLSGAKFGRGTPMVTLPLINRDIATSCYTYGLFQPWLLPVKGFYNEYGVAEVDLSDPVNAEVHGFNKQLTPEIEWKDDDYNSMHRHVINFNDKLEKYNYPENHNLPAISFACYHLDAWNYAVENCQYLRNLDKIIENKPIFNSKFCPDKDMKDLFVEQGNYEIIREFIGCSIPLYAKLSFNNKTYKNTLIELAKVMSFMDSHGIIITPFVPMGSQHLEESDVKEEVKFLEFSKNLRTKILEKRKKDREE